jgi:hypothetical protein
MKQQASDSAKGLANSARGLAKKKAKLRTDAAGRSGMGESATSNMRFKGGSQYSSANKTANAAAATAKKTGGNLADASSAYTKSMAGAAAYAWKNKKK